MGTQINNMVKITTTQFPSGRIEIETEVFGKLTKKVMETQEEGIRQALIQLGWTPPRIKQRTS